MLPAGNGVVLTIDLCPAARPLDRGLFSSVSRSFAAAEHPVPIGIAITGLWMREHPQDLAWLRQLERSGDIAVTWINHSFNHRYARELPLSRNFLLEPGTNPELEILGHREGDDRERPRAPRSSSGFQASSPIARSSAASSATA